MDCKRILLIFSIILLFLGSSLAITYTVSEHSLNIQINNENDKIEERFYITFPNESSKLEFRENSIKLGTSLENWKLFDKLFTPSVVENTLNKKIAYNEGEQNYLSLSYDLSEPLMAKGKETNMLTEYLLKVNYFNSFYQSGLWIVPDNTKIIVELPAGADVRDAIEPEAITTKQGNKTIITWQGYKSANKLSLNYVLWEKMDPLVDLSAFNTFLFKTQTGQLVILVIVIIIGILFWQRKRIVEEIENFVEKNSLIKEE